MIGWPVLYSSLGYPSKNLASLAAPQHPPLLFPRSVSPYVTRRKSHGHRLDDDGGDGDGDGVDDSWSHHHLRFLTTPQLGPTYSSSSTASSCQRKYAKLSQLANFFRLLILLSPFVVDFEAPSIVRPTSEIRVSMRGRLSFFYLGLRFAVHQLRVRPDYEHLNDPLHILVEPDLPGNIVDIRLREAHEITEELLKSVVRP
ncbi:KH domain-containing protein At2g38610 [Linum grandiflorum]